MKWNICTVTEESLRHATRADFRKGAPGAYRYALRTGILDHLFPASANKLQRAIELAQQRTLVVGWRGFRTDYPAEYQMLRRNGYYPDGTPWPKNATPAEWHAQHPRNK